MNDTEDLRVRRTRKLLWEALLALIEHEDFERITVTAICEKAMVHRTTFYKHYLDKYDLLEQGARALFTELAAEFMDAAVVLWETSPQNPPAHFVRVFEHAREHRRFYQLVIGERTFRALLFDFLQEQSRGRLRQVGAAGHTLTIPEVIVVQFSAGALLTVLTWWIENDLPHPPDDMARWLMTLLIEGSQGALAPGTKPSA
ncbi:MAG: TetR family transcriptional regulator [Chloroflexi bacterium]|nr:TetR family transcriptional regulator [Chloroflexota bacterium]